MLRLQIRSNESKKYCGYKFVDISLIDYENEKLSFIIGYENKKPILINQSNFNNTEFRLFDNKTSF